MPEPDPATSPIAVSTGGIDRRRPELRGVTPHRRTRLPWIGECDPRATHAAKPAGKERPQRSTKTTIVLSFLCLFVAISSSWFDDLQFASQSKTINCAV